MIHKSLSEILHSTTYLIYGTIHYILSSLKSVWIYVRLVYDGEDIINRICLVTVGWRDGDGLSLLVSGQLRVCDTDLRTRSSLATGKLRGASSSAEPLIFSALPSLLGPIVLSPLFNLTLSPISHSKCEFCKTVKKSWRTHLLPKLRQQVDSFFLE